MLSYWRTTDKLLKRLNILKNEIKQCWGKTNFVQKINRTLDQDLKKDNSIIWFNPRLKVKKKLGHFYSKQDFKEIGQHYVSDLLQIYIIFLGRCGLIRQGCNFQSIIIHVPSLDLHITIWLPRNLTLTMLIDSNFEIYKKFFVLSYASWPR